MHAGLGGSIGRQASRQAGRWNEEAVGPSKLARGLTEKLYSSNNRQHVHGQTASCVSICEARDLHTLIKML